MESYRKDVLETERERDMKYCICNCIWSLKYAHVSEHSHPGQTSGRQHSSLGNMPVGFPGEPAATAPTGDGEAENMKLQTVSWGTRKQARSARKHLPVCKAVHSILTRQRCMFVF